MTSEELYNPASDFLQMVIADEITFEGEFGEQNLARLIALTTDNEKSNRDWATMLLAQMELQRPDVISALLAAAEDADIDVRSEAILGIALLNRELALPLVQRELGQDRVQAQIFEAAEKLADPSLVDDLEDFQNPSDSNFVDATAGRALIACKSAQERTNS